MIALGRSLTAAALFLLGLALVTHAQQHDPSEHLLDSSFRNRALRGVLPPRLLSGDDQAMARTSGDIDARGGPEIALVYEQDHMLVLSILREAESGAWRKLAEFRRDHPGISRLSFVSFEHGAPQLLLVHWFLGGSVRMGQLEVFAWRRATDDVRSILTVPATSYHVQDVDADRVPELIVERDTPGVSGVPEVYRWDGQGLGAPIQNLSRFYIQVAKQFQNEADYLIGQTPRGKPVPLEALDKLLNAAGSLEQAGRKDEAFRTYRRVAALSRKSLIRRRSDPEQPLRDQRGDEAREGMARLLGRPSRAKRAEPSTPVTTPTSK